MRPEQARTKEELFQALIETDDQAPFVNLSLLVDIFGLERARTLTPIRTHGTVSKQACLTLLQLKRAEDLLSPEQLAALYPKIETLEHGTNDHVETNQDPQQPT
jgi:hypothetical protein